MRLFDQLYRFVDGVTDFSATVFNGIWRSIDERLHALEERDNSFQGRVDAVVTDAQDKVQAVLDPAITTVRQILENGLSTAASQTPHSLEEDARLVFVITDDGRRETFTPSTFAILTRKGSAADRAVVSVNGYEAATGALDVTVVTVSGNPGPHSDWEIGAVAGTTLAQLEYLAEGEAARAAAVSAAGTATNAAESVQTLVEQVKDGPVATVNGVPGPEVVLGADAIQWGGNGSVAATLRTLSQSKANNTAVYSRTYLDAQLRAKLGTDEADRRYPRQHRLDGGTC